MTVRKWIDRSIAGLETRSGDYPVTSTRFVAIIIMLTGLENIPRIGELKEIRAQYNQRIAGEKAPGDTDVNVKDSSREPVAVSSGSSQRPPVLRDVMISIPKNTVSGDPERVPSPRPPAISSDEEVPAGTVKPKPVTVPHQRRVIITTPHEMTQASGSIPAPEKEAYIPVKKILASQQSPHSPDKNPASLDDRTRLKDQERKKIERELQKQRLIAIGRDQKLDRHLQKTPDTASTSHPQEKVNSGDAPSQKSDSGEGARHVIHKKQDLKKIVLYKKGEDPDRIIPPTPSPQKDVPDKKISSNERESVTETVQRDQAGSIDDWIKQAPPRKKDEFFEQEIFKLKDVPQIVRDDVLVHTNLQRERTSQDSDTVIMDKNNAERPKEIEPSLKKHNKKRSGDDDDVIWVR
jgi:hypothetical protein